MAVRTESEANMTPYEQTLENDGGTFTQKGDRVEVAQGYAVGVHKGSFRVVDASPTAFRKAWNEVREAYPKDFIGTWYEDGWIHVDPVVIFNLRKHAEMYAREFEQRAIYNFATGEVEVIE